MAKIMLVEDDRSLQEIYSIRLVAEGYDIAKADDGEEALANFMPTLILPTISSGAKAISVCQAAI